jgi:hypothetical protein
MTSVKHVSMKHFMVSSPGEQMETNRLMGGTPRIGDGEAQTKLTAPFCTVA